MTDELARRIGVWLTATGRWRPGMLMRDCENGDMIRLCWSDGMYWHCYYPIHGWLRIVRETMRDRYAPNITDGATRGGLEDILRERWPHAEVTWAAEDWEDKKPVGGWFCECGTAEVRVGPSRADAGGAAGSGGCGGRGVGDSGDSVGIAGGWDLVSIRVVFCCIPKRQGVRSLARKRRTTNRETP